MDNPDRVTYFAATDSRGKRIPFGIKEKDRSRHMYIIGKTGMGKSTTLENMAIQDMRNGEGLAFIDPHGSTADKLLEYVPKDRINDVVYFAPFDLEHPIAFNVMEDVGYDKRHLVVSGLMATFKKIWVDAWSARMEYILSNTLLALLEYPDATLLGVNRMYTDKAYRKLVVDNVKDPVVKDFWVKEFAGYTDKFTAEATPAIQNKIGQFTSNPLIRNIIGQPKSSFDIRDLMDKKKILIINLSKGQVGETNMMLLGSMLTTRLFLGAMSRAEHSGAEIAKLPHFFFYVDEFQNFANDTFAGILSEARKYKLNLIIAHQYVEQMEEQVRAAVFGNVGTTIAFRVGPFDAEVLETVFMPEFTKEDLVNLGFAQIYLSLMIDGVGSRPFSAVTIPPIEPPAIICKQEVIEASRRQFGTARAGVEEAIFSALMPKEPPMPTSGPGTGKPLKREYDLTQDNRPPRQPERQSDRREGASAPRRDTPRSDGPRNDTLREPREPRRDDGRAQQKPRRDQAPRTEQQRPSSNEKTAEDLRAILRTMSAGATKQKDEKKGSEQNSLKGALTDVLKTALPVPEKEELLPPPPPKPRPTPPPEPQPQKEASVEPAATPTAKPYEVPQEQLKAIFQEPL